MARASAGGGGGSKGGKSSGYYSGLKSAYSSNAYKPTSQASGQYKKISSQLGERAKSGNDFSSGAGSAFSTLRQEKAMSNRGGGGTVSAVAKPGNRKKAYQNSLVDAINANKFKPVANKIKNSNYSILDSNLRQKSVIAGYRGDKGAQGSADGARAGLSILRQDAAAARRGSVDRTGPNRPVASQRTSTQRNPLTSVGGYSGRDWAGNPTKKFTGSIGGISFGKSYEFAKAFRNFEAIADALIEDEVMYFEEEDVEKGLPSALKAALKSGRYGETGTNIGNAAHFRMKRHAAGAAVPKRGKWQSNSVGNAMSQGRSAADDYKSQLAYANSRRGYTGGMLKPTGQTRTAARMDAYGQSKGWGQGEGANAVRANLQSKLAAQRARNIQRGTAERPAF